MILYPQASTLGKSNVFKLKLSLLLGTIHEHNISSGYEIPELICLSSL